MTLLVTGATGFLGQSFLRHIHDHPLDRPVIAVKRKMVFEDVISGEPLEHRKVLQPGRPVTVLHLATVYDPNPNDAQALTTMLEANVQFGLDLYDLLKHLNPKFVLAQSYMELLPLARQNEYALSKTIYAKFLHRYAHGICNLFLFDTFGRGDMRGKVVDVFIDRILAGQPITIPTPEARINLLSGQSVAGAFVRALEAQPGEYRIANPMDTRLVDLAQMIADLSGKNAEIKTGGPWYDALADLSRHPANLVARQEDLKARLADRIEERRWAQSS